MPIFADPRLRGDMLGSGMNLNRDRLVDLLGDVGSQIAGGRLQQQAEMALAALEANPTTLEPWWGLATIVGNLPIYPALRERLRTTVDELPLAALCGDDGMPLAIALPIIATTYSLDKTEAAVGAFVDRLVGVLRLVDGTAGKAQQQILQNIVDVTYSAAMGIESQSGRRRAFFSGLKKLFRSSRGLCDAIAPVILRFHRVTASDVQSEVAELLFICRTRASRGVF